MERRRDEVLALIRVMTRPGIHCLPIPTPFAVGRVNCYLIEDDPLTLVDTGPNSGKALDELELALRAHGHSIEDLERIVITHQHLDHMGLAGILARRSEAEVVRARPAGARDRGVRRACRARRRARRGADAAPRHPARRRDGAAHDVARVPGLGRRARRSTAGWPTASGSSSPTARCRRCTGPGHSPSDTLFWDAERRVLIGGDHLIGHISSNPLISRPLGGRSGEPGDGRPRALMTYLRSLRETREMPIDVVLPGHGEPVTEHAS